MYKRIFLIAAIAVLSACASQKPRPPAHTAPVPPPTSQQTPPATIEVSGSEQRIIQATNAFRAENKLAPLKPKVQLIITAQNHARNMARQDKFGDTDKNGHVLDGHGFDYRIQVSGYPFERVAENVGYQLRHQDAVGDMMTDWKKSPGHRRNMLIPELTEIGTGAAQGKSGRWYFVQVFGRPLPAKQTQLDEVFVVAQQRH
ncbi:MAG: CAP domain-containing protein [Betaproteobacteria bacterium]